MRILDGLEMRIKVAKVGAASVSLPGPDRNLFQLLSPISVGVAAIKCGELLGRPPNLVEEGGGGEFLRQASFLAPGRI